MHGTHIGAPPRIPLPFPCRYADARHSPGFSAANEQRRDFRSKVILDYRGAQTACEMSKVRYLINLGWSNGQGERGARAIGPMRRSHQARFECKTETSRWLDAARPSSTYPFRKETQLGSQTPVHCSPPSSHHRRSDDDPFLQTPLFPLWRRSVLDQSMREGFGYRMQKRGKGRSPETQLCDPARRSRSPSTMAHTPLAAETLQTPSARMHEGLPVREIFFLRTCRQVS